MSTLKWKCIRCEKVYEIERCSNCEKEAVANLQYVNDHEIGGTSLVCKLCGYITPNFTCTCGAVNKFSADRQIFSAPCDVTIYRTSRFSGVLVIADIYINNELVLKIGNGQKMTMKVFPGKKVLRAGTAFNYRTIDVNFIEGHQYVFEISFEVSGIVIKQKES